MKQKQNKATQCAVLHNNIIIANINIANYTDYYSSRIRNRSVIIVHLGLLGYKGFPRNTLNKTKQNTTQQSDVNKHTARIIIAVSNTLCMHAQYEIHTHIII